MGVLINSTAVQPFCNLPQANTFGNSASRSRHLIPGGFSGMLLPGWQRTIT